MVGCLKHDWRCFPCEALFQLLDNSRVFEPRRPPHSKRSTGTPSKDAHLDDCLNSEDEGERVVCDLNTSVRNDSIWSRSRIKKPEEMLDNHGQISGSKARRRLFCWSTLPFFESRPLSHFYCIGLLLVYSEGLHRKQR